MPIVSPPAARQPFPHLAPADRGESLAFGTLGGAAVASLLLTVASLNHFAAEFDHTVAGDRSGLPARTDPMLMTLKQVANPPPRVCCGGAGYDGHPAAMNVPPGHR